MTDVPKDRKRARSRNDVMVFQDVAWAKTIIECAQTKHSWKRMIASSLKRATDFQQYEWFEETDLVNGHCFGQRKKGVKFRFLFCW